MTVASFIASQRTEHSVPHALCCRVLEVSESWFYKWRDRPPTARQERRRRRLDEAVKKFFEDSAGTYGSPRIHADLIEAGWTVSQKTVAVSMAAQGLVARHQGADARSPGPTKPQLRCLNWSNATSAPSGSTRSGAGN